MPEGSPQMKAGWTEIRQKANRRVSPFGFICVHPVFICGDISPLWRDKIETNAPLCAVLRYG
jgi:hypothetical protein